MTRPHGDEPARGALVIGLGSADRGDDAVGATVARAVAAVGAPGIRVVEHEDPTALLDLWTDAETVVVVDAVVSGREPGTIHVLETGAGEQALPAGAWGSARGGGTHAFGLAASVELARALRLLPARLVLVGIEASCFDHGRPLSEPVAAAVERTIRTVLAVLADAAPPPSPPPSLPTGRGEDRVSR